MEDKPRDMTIPADDRSTPADIARNDANGHRGKPLLALLVIAGLWLLVFNQLRLEWTVNPLYAYGWAIPFLSLYLFWERWQGRPAARPRGFVGPLVVAAACLAAYFPIRLLQEANPDWILISWTMNTLAVMVTLAALHYAGGTPWSRNFLFPVLFTFTAVAWPVAFENFILQNLMQGNAVLVAEVLTLAGKPTFVAGNILSVGGEIIGVDEACSGIRSLQTAFMASLFFGEFFRLSLIGRVWLVLLSFVLASILNFGRTLVLTWVGGTRGAEALEGWHDPLGFAVLALCLAGLWGLAMLFARKSSGTPAPAIDHALAAPRAVPLLVAIPAIAWLLLAETATVAWYRFHESQANQAAEWSVRWPAAAHDLREHAFSETVQTILKYNEGRSASWRCEDGFDWSVSFLRWEPGRVSRNLATAHSPEICFPATGLELDDRLGTASIAVGNITIPFRVFRFTEREKVYFVFHALVEDVERDFSAAAGTGELSRDSRLRSTLNGERNLGQRMLGVLVRGPADAEEAEAAVARQLKEMIESPAGASPPYPANKETTL